MQLTRFDRWLRERFIYQTHIYTMRLPEGGVPPEVMVEELGESASRRYRYRLIVNAKRDLKALLGILREGNLMFATRVIETNPWYKTIIAPKDKSFSFRVFWWGVAAVSVMSVLVTSAVVLSNEELRAELLDTINLFFNG